MDLLIHKYSQEILLIIRYYIWNYILCFNTSLISWQDWVSSHMTHDRINNPKINWTTDCSSAIHYHWLYRSIIIDLKNLLIKTTFGFIDLISPQYHSDMLFLLCVSSCLYVYTSRSEYTCSLSTSWGVI